MAEDRTSKPDVTKRGAAAAGSRDERLAAALRANLGRRKAQARNRAAGVAVEPPSTRDGRDPAAGALERVPPIR